MMYKNSSAVQVYTQVDEIRWHLITYVLLSRSDRRRNWAKETISGMELKRENAYYMWEKSEWFSLVRPHPVK